MTEIDIDFDEWNDDRDQELVEVVDVSEAGIDIEIIANEGVEDGKPLFTRPKVTVRDGVRDTQSR